MNRSAFCVLSLFTFVTTAAFAAESDADLTPAPSQRALPAATIPDRYIVQVAPGADPRSIAAGHRVAPDFVYQRAVNGFAGFVPPGRLAALRADPRVLHVSPDRHIAAIAKPGTGGGGGTTTTQVVPAGVARIGAAPGTIVAGAPIPTGAGIGIAVVDTGVDLAHRDLTPLGAGFSAYGGTPQDQHGHGTHVAGTIAARNNTVDVVGVAPAATIHPVKVLDASGSGSDSAVVAGLDWVAANAASNSIRVVNMSLGRAGTLDDAPAMRTAVQNLVSSGIVVVVAAGNDPALEAKHQVPATYPEVIAVASTTALAGINQYRLLKTPIGADTASYFTSDGAFNETTRIGVTISAPGEDQEDVTKAGFIQSVGILSTKLGGGTTRMSGTSMAAPHVAGVVALILKKYPGASPETVRTLLRGGAANASAPLDSPTSSYSFDGQREGVVYVPTTLD